VKVIATGRLCGAAISWRVYLNLVRIQTWLVALLVLSLPYPVLKFK